MKNKMYLSKSAFVILAATTGIVTVETLKNQGGKIIIQNPQYEQLEPCELSIDEQNQIETYNSFKPGEIRYENCEFLEKTETEIILKETFPFKYKVKKNENFEKIINSFYVIDTDEYYEKIKMDILEYNNLPLDITYEVSRDDIIILPLTRRITIDKKDAHCIEKHETTYSISEMYDVPLLLLENINGVSKKTHYIQAGDYLVIPTNSIKVNTKNHK